MCKKLMHWIKKKDDEIRDFSFKIYDNYFAKTATQNHTQTKVNNKNKQQNDCKNYKTDDIKQSFTNFKKSSSLKIKKYIKTSKNIKCPNNIKWCANFKKCASCKKSNFGKSKNNDANERKCNLIKKANPKKRVVFKLKKSSQNFSSEIERDNNDIKQHRQMSDRQVMDNIIDSYKNNKRQ